MDAGEVVVRGYASYGLAVEKMEPTTPDDLAGTVASKRKAEDSLGGPTKRSSRAETPELQGPSQPDPLVAALRRQQPQLPLADSQLQGLLGLLDLVKQDGDDRAAVNKDPPPVAIAGAPSATPDHMPTAPPPLTLSSQDRRDADSLHRPKPTPQIRPAGFPRRNYKQTTRQVPHNQWVPNCDSSAGRGPAYANPQQQSSGEKKAQARDTRPRPYVCQFGCGYAATKLRYVTEHERTHTGARPYQCTWEGCNYRSSGSGHMARHMRTHTGDRPFKCTEPGCNYASSQSGHLKTHMRKHTGERPFRCPTPGCSYAASRPGHLRRHMKVHETVSDWHSSRGYAHTDASARPRTAAE